MIATFSNIFQGAGEQIASPPECLVHVSGCSDACQPEPKLLGDAV